MQTVSQQNMKNIFPVHYTMLWSCSEMSDVGDVPCTTVQMAQPRPRVYDSSLIGSETAPRELKGAATLRQNSDDEGERLAFGASTN